MDTLELIKKLVSVPAVSGTEDNLQDVLREILEPIGTVSTDSMNNLFCTVGEGYHFLLDTHTDEIGFVVTEITDSGFLRVSNCGGIDRRLLLAAEVSVWGKREVRGVISTLPPHLQKDGDESKVPEIDEIAIDIGMTHDEAASIISFGDRVTFAHYFTELLDGRISSNCLDDRAGCAAIILALNAVKDLPVRVTAMFSSQEEVGIRGAKVGPFGKNIDEAIAVDVSFGYTPDCKKEECGELSKGAMIGISPILDNEISKGLISAAEAAGVQYQTEIMNGVTGTNADVISITESGIKCGLVSIPLKYMHTPIEVIDVKDVESTANVIAAYIREKAGVLNA